MKEIAPETLYSARFHTTWIYVQLVLPTLLTYWPAVWLAGVHVVLVQVPQSCQLITNKAHKVPELAVLLLQSFHILPTYIETNPVLSEILNTNLTSLISILAVDIKTTTPSLVHILSHEDLAVWPFSKEVLWSWSFPGGSFGFVICCPI